MAEGLRPDGSRAGGPGDGGTGDDHPGYRPGHRQEGWDLRFDWGAEGLQAIAAGASAVVIVDVLRFTSAVSVAVARGAVVLPFPWGRGDAARAYAADHGAELAGLREHGAWSLSPTDLAGLSPGTRLVLPSPNGSALAFAARDGMPGARVLAGCLRNAAAVAAAAGATGGPVAVVAAGERWHGAQGTALRPSIEDMLGAGAVLRALVDAAGGAAGSPSPSPSPSASPSASPEAEGAMAVFDAARGDLGGWLARSGSGRELASIGFDDDVAAAAVLDADAVAPVLGGAAFSAVVAPAVGHLR